MRGEQRGGAGEVNGRRGPEFCQREESRQAPGAILDGLDAEVLAQEIRMSAAGGRGRSLIIYLIYSLDYVSPVSLVFGDVY